LIGKKFSVFKQIANRKGWIFEDIGNQRDIDADTDLSGKAHLDHHAFKGF
jgi:hypothetical protein